jgi:hypothetical protein
VSCEDVVGGRGEGDDVVVVGPHDGRDFDDVVPAVIIPIFLLAVDVCCCSEREDSRLDSIEPGRRVGLVAPGALAASSWRWDARQLTRWREKVLEWPARDGSNDGKRESGSRKQRF